ncbi:MAG: hypothetical protein E6X17_08965 [Sporomusaceae bacterium]|nr:hypothetical protein [Sporomusaceae bacterium]
MKSFIAVRDHETCLQISYQDLIQYHGRTFIAGVAMAFKLLQLVADRLVDGVLPRGELQAVLAVNGPGIIDGIEMATRAKTHGCLLVNQRIAATRAVPDAADGQGGKYYFVFSCRGRQLAVWLQDGLVPQEFLDLAYKTHDGSISQPEKARLQQLKEELAVFLISLPPEAIFHYSLQASEGRD